MNYREAQEAISDASNTLRRADEMANDIIKLLPGRLRKINKYYSVEAMKDLKRELKDFNAKTGEWKS